jgi:hypothetical protein
VHIFVHFGDRDPAHLFGTSVALGAPREEIHENAPKRQGCTLISQQRINAVFKGVAGEMKWPLQSPLEGGTNRGVK